MTTLLPKVLLVTYEYGTQIGGGVGRVINGLVTSSLSVEMDVLYVRPDLQPEYQVVLYSKDNPKEVSFSGPAAVIKGVVAVGGYNIIHFTNAGPHSYHLLKELRKLQEPSIKIVSVHSISKYDRHIRPELEDCELYEGYMFHNANSIHLLCPSSYQAFASAYPNLVGTKDFWIIPNGVAHHEIQIAVELKRQQLLDSGNPKGENVICCISRWSKGKGLECLIDSIPMLLKNMPIRVLIAGRRPNSWEKFGRQYVDRIDRKIHELKDYVQSVGWLNDSERNDLFAKSQVVVMPSELEYQPYSILEPASAMVPIVASDLPSVRDILDDNACFFFPARNPSALAEQIQLALQNKNLAHAKALNAYKSVAAKHDWREVARSYCAMYSALI